MAYITLSLGPIIFQAFFVLNLYWGQPISTLKPQSDLKWVIRIVSLPTIESCLARIPGLYWSLFGSKQYQNCAVADVSAWLCAELFVWVCEYALTFFAHTNVVDEKYVWCACSLFTGNNKALFTNESGAYYDFLVSNLIFVLLRLVNQKRYKCNFSTALGHYTTIVCVCVRYLIEKDWIFCRIM